MYRYQSQHRASPWPRLILLIAVGLAILIGAIALTLPRVTNASPQGDHVSALAPVTLAFNADMDTASVESRFHLEPQVPGTLTWLGRTLQFTPRDKWPVGTMRVSLLSGATSTSGLPMLYDNNWEFTVGAPGIAYLHHVGDAVNIFTLPLTTGAEPTQVTTERFGVDQFALTPDALQFIYAALRADGGADLKRINRDGSGLTDVLACPADRCTGPAISPDGNFLAFERHPIERTDQSTIEVLNLATNERKVLDDNPAHISRFPVFSTDGRLAYLNTFDQYVAIYDLATGASQRISNTSGQMGAWSADGAYFVFPQITSALAATPIPGTPAPALQLDTSFSHLQQVTVNTGLVTDLSHEGGAVEDANAVYSPTGEWLAFGRKYIEQDLWTPGRQLWVMRADGSGARALTNDPLYNHSNFIWNPEGTQVVFVRFDVTDPASLTEIWRINVNGANAEKLVTDGLVPVWLP